MQRYLSHLNTAVKILQSYDGTQPLVHFLKNFFKADKKYGSRDRKEIAQLCYTYFRIGHCLKAFPMQHRILCALFLCSDTENELLKNIKPEWNEKAAFSLADKFSLLGIENPVREIFPWIDELSTGIESGEFASSHLQQPDVFIRIRPGNHKNVFDKINKTGISYRKLKDDCIAFSNSTKIDEILQVNKEVVIQDYSSQRIAEFLTPQAFHLSPSTFNLHSVWDCCAGSGGKAILAFDLLQPANLTVSDIRVSILANLKKRFVEAGIRNYKSFVANISNGNIPSQIRGSQFDLVVADVPCSGSGTWGRNPESLYYFDEKKIKDFNSLQKKIVGNIIPQIGKNGFLLYITCSVFKKENEGIVDFMREKFGLVAVKMELLKGYTEKADSMFAALLTSAR